MRSNTLTRVSNNPGAVQVKRRASIGSNATVLCGVTIGEEAVIGAGSVVTKDVPARAVAAGNPAKTLRYLD